jgi:hypothetical protein
MTTLLVGAQRTIYGDAMIGNHCQHVASTQLTTTQMLPSAIARIGAREILVDQNVQDIIGHEYLLGHRGQYMVMR